MKPKDYEDPRDFNFKCKFVNRGGGTKVSAIVCSYVCMRISIGIVLRDPPRVLSANSFAMLQV